MKKLIKWTPFDVFNVFLMSGMSFIMLYPMLYAIAGAFNDGNDYLRGGVYLLPRQWTLDNFRVLFRDGQIMKAYLVTAEKAILGTISNLTVTTLAAYAITRPNLKFKRVYLVYIMFTMFFGGGLIPYYILITKIKLYDTFWVYIIPGLFSVWGMLIMQSYIRDLPESITESAKIDGAGEYRILAQIVVPLCIPLFAALGLFGIVGHWNAYWDSLMFTRSQNLRTIMRVLQQIINEAQSLDAMMARAVQSSQDIDYKPTPQTLKLAAMVATALPIVASYPFLQRYFVKGVTLGSVKGG